MKTLLRHTHTGSYFESPDRWTEDPDRAFDFRFLDRAVQYSATWELAEVELVYAFSDQMSVTTVPLNATEAR
jgi:hypothetical protein